MNWFLNAWDWLRHTLFGPRNPTDDEWTEMMDESAREIAARVRVFRFIENRLNDDRRARLTDEIARLKRNKKRWTHLQSELDKMP